jgi:hypothetical protein
MQAAVITPKPNLRGGWTEWQWNASGGASITANLQHACIVI